MAKKPEWVIRFAAAKNGKICSGIWRVWKNKGDSIYIHPRNIGGEVKISLHQNERGRRYRFAETSDRVKRTRGGDGSRPAIIAWDRVDTPDAGASHAMTILFAPELLSPRETKPDDQTTVLELPEPGNAIQVDMAYIRQSPESLKLSSNQRLLGHAKLDSGENFVVVAAAAQFDLRAFVERSNFTWPIENTVLLTELTDPQLSVVLCGVAANVLHVLEVSNVAAASAGP